MADGRGETLPEIAFLFPGQGAQSIGMAAEVAKSVPAAGDLFATASKLLGYDLLEICAGGPEARLNSTAVSQPALYVAGLAAVEKLRSEDPDAVEKCGFACGLSLGEYTALVFAGAMSFEDGLRVVKARAESMQQAADATESGMVSVLGLDEENVQALCAQASSAGHIRIANLLCPGNIAVSGERAACEEVERLAESFGAMKTVRLAVAGAFHTQIMRPADEKLAAALDQVTIQSPRIPVISNVDARSHSDPAEIREILVRQVLEPVLWERSMRNLLEAGVGTFYELGPGRVLAGLFKRIHRRANVVNVQV
jgi:[acyl-carrier-protein] S-malonyltransferase